MRPKGVEPDSMKCATSGKQNETELQVDGKKRVIMVNRRIACIDINIY